MRPTTLILAALTSLGLFALGLRMLPPSHSVATSTGPKVEQIASTDDGALRAVAQDSSAPAAAAKHLTPAEALKRIVDSEQFILAMTPKLADLNKSILDLHLPKPTTRGWFEEESSTTDITGSFTTEDLAQDGGPPVRIRHWQIQPGAKRVFAENLDLWRPLLAEVDYFEHAKFYLVKGEFTDADRETWHGVMGFSGLARSQSGQWWGVKSKQTVEFRRQASSGDAVDQEPLWLISEWRTTKFETTEIAQRLFREVLDEAIPDEAARKRARTSIHEGLVVSHIRNGERPHPLFEIIAWDRHPGIAVVDIDQDGFDDIYVMARWGKNQMFRNRRDGTFEEIAGRLGLDIEDHTSSAIFADFDNDGDLDAFLGRTLERSMYLVNEDGYFVDRSSGRVVTPLPYLASSISAADYNGDGLLDLYISTFAGQMLFGARRQHDPDLTALRALLPDEHANALMELFSSPSSHGWLNEPGPPNVLLRNIGDGRFAVANEDDPTLLFRNTYQAAWSDYDNDGDPDMYCANDLAPDNLFRNEGDGTFTDVTNSEGTTSMGFAMGASWGDYDSDGRQDLYVTNMYSKAGSRITAGLDGLRDHFSEMAQGNWLYRNTEDGFEKVSGYDDDQQQVQAAGWGWGSQFVDINNSGDLDIYALSGYYSAPTEVAQTQDF